MPIPKQARHSSRGKPGSAARPFAGCCMRGAAPPPSRPGDAQAQEPQAVKVLLSEKWDQLEYSVLTPASEQSRFDPNKNIGAYK